MNERLCRRGLLIVAVCLMTAAARGENLIPNGSFEVGIGQWIGFDSGQRGGKRDNSKYGEMTQVKEGLISDAEAKLGRHSFCFNYPGFIRSREIELDPSKKYTMSLYAKSKEGRGQLGVSMSSSYRPGRGHGDRLSSAGLGVKVGTEWQRHHLTVALPESRNGYYKIWISHPEADVVWIDGVQLEEGETVTDYAPSARAEVGISSGREGESDLFYTTETVPVRTEVCVYEKGAKEATINYVLWDYRDFKVKESDRAVKLDADGYGTDSFELSPEWQGLMSLIATVEAGGKELGREELVFGSVRPPRPASEAEDQISPVGTHVSKMRDIQVAERLGIRWQRYHDFFDKDGSVRWIDVEPEEGKWFFQDASFDRYRGLGFNLVGTLHRVPKWAFAHPDDVKSGRALHLPAVAKWREYVSRTVSQYKDRIHYWEVWNEPFSAAWWADTPENYFVLLKTTWEAAKEADPDCKILGGCLATLDYASTRSFMNRLFASGGLDYMDILSIHADTGGMTPTGPSMPEEQMGGGGETVSQAFGEITDLMRAYGEVKPIWNTEHPVWCMPYSRLYPWVDDVPWNRQSPPQNPVDGAQFVVRSVVAEVANNCPKTFFYPFSGGRYEDGDLTSSIMSGHMHLKSSGVVMSELLLQTGRGTFVKEVDWGNVARCYLFETPEGPLAVAWGLRARDKAGTLHLGAEAGTFRYLDIMGNARRDIARSGGACALPLGAEPVYIRADAMKTLERALASGRVTGLMSQGAGEALRADRGILGEVVYAGERELVKDLWAYAFERSGGSAAIIVSKRKDYPVLALADGEGLVIREAGGEIDVSEKAGEERVVEIMTTPIVVESEEAAADTLLARLQEGELRGLREFELEGVWITTAEGEPVLTVRLTNVSLGELSPAVVVKGLPAGAEVESKQVEMAALAAGGTEAVEIGLSHAGAPVEIWGEAVIEVVGGKEPVTFKRALALAYSLRAEQGITVDGDLAEWSDKGVFVMNRKDQVKIGQSAWKGPEDLSARVRSRWDEDAVYLAVEVTDEFLERRQGAMYLYDGTGIEIFVDTNQREDLGTAMYDKDDFQILFGPATPAFPTDNWGIAPKSGKSYLAGLVMVSKKTSEGYAMEIALPREMFEMELLPGVLKANYGAGMSMGLSVVANDRAKEKEGRKSGIIWGGTPLNHKDPTRFGTLILMP